MNSLKLDTMPIHLTYTIDYHKHLSHFLMRGNYFEQDPIKKVCNEFIFWINHFYRENSCCQSSWGGILGVNHFFSVKAFQFILMGQQKESNLPLAVGEAAALASGFSRWSLLLSSNKHFHVAWIKRKKKYWNWNCNAELINKAEKINYV